MRLLLLLIFFSLSSVPTAVAETASSSWISKRKKKRKKRRKRKRRRGRQKKAPKKRKSKPATKPPKAQPKKSVVAPPTAPPKAADAADDRPNVAVMSFHAVHGVEQSVANLLSEILLTQVGNAPHFSQVIGGSDMEELLNLEQQKSALGCDHDSCLSTLGGALGVALMIAPSIGKLGDQYILNLKIINVDEAVVRARVNVEIDSERELKAKLEATITTLLEQAFRPVVAKAPKEGPVSTPKDESALPAKERNASATGTETQSPRLASLGVGLMGLGLIASASAYYLHHQTHATFNASAGTLSDYDKGLEGTHYANLGLGAGLISLASGGITWWLSR